ncbi:TlpA family protein disulfide reductase [Dinghuibacter silviterrae]|uniref:AhpC/TSA family protein n=1 Tax=Dinghuibacter silviterrae TaxID=1539049 RepID=A0A4R8DS26_9BACT|nr:redoxin family protein [Dinghuibacter silviterrae]TDX00646.1 AhpC/TSA family protein [Dinghuibacter silviterrae]
MKKNLYLLALAASLLMAVPGKSQQTSPQQPQEPQLPYQSDKTLPSFNILEVDSTTIFNTKKLPSGKPIVLMYFSPDCEHCQHQTEAILSKMDSLKGVRFVMLTSLPFDKMKNFYFYYKLADYKNITMGRDYEFFFSRHYGSQYVPYLAIYDRHKKLVKVFDGGTTVTNLIQLVTQD